MILEVKNSITGDFIAPKSKSLAIRAAIAAFLANKEIRLRDYPRNSDSLAALQLIRQLGGATIFDKADLIIKGGSLSFPEVINCGESGLCLNIAVALALNSENLVTLTGEKTLLTRDFMHLMNNLFINEIHYTAHGFNIPLIIYPNPNIDTFRIDGSKTSQLASSMLLAAIFNPQLKFSVRNLVSTGYFEMTRALLTDFGYQTIEEDVTFSLTKTSEPPDVYEIEADWSGIANILVAAAISGDISVQGLNPNSLQPDRVIIDILKDVGANVSFSENILRVKSGKLHPFNLSIEDCPDLFPVLCVLAAYTKGTSTISGIGRLKHKETMRGLVMKNEISKTGIQIRIVDDTATIVGGKPKGADFSSNNDHRIAMALTIASVFASSKSTLSEPECVEKSYPDFFHHLGISYKL